MPNDPRIFRRSDQHNIEVWGEFVKITAPNGEVYEMRNWKHDRGANGNIKEWRIDGEWNFDISKFANTGVVRIYNLVSQSSRVWERGKHLKFETGYLGPSSGSIVSVLGTITDMKEFRENDVSRGTQITFADSPEFILAKSTSRWWKPNVLQLDVWNALLQDLGLTPEIVSPASPGIYKDGMSVFGRIWPEMGMVAEDMGSKMYVYNSKVRLMPRDDGIQTEIIVDGISLERYRQAYQSHQFPGQPIFVGSNEKEMLLLTLLLEPGLESDSIFTVGPLTEAEQMEKGIGQLETGPYRVVRGRHYIDNKKFRTAALCLPQK